MTEIVDSSRRHKIVLTVAGAIGVIIASWHDASIKALTVGGMVMGSLLLLVWRTNLVEHVFRRGLRDRDR